MQPSSRGSEDYVEVDQAEIMRAHMGFSIEHGSVPKHIEDTFSHSMHKSRAALVVAGNIALLNHIPETTGSYELVELRSAAQATVDSGILLGALAGRASAVDVSSLVRS